MSKKGAKKKVRARWVLKLKGNIELKVKRNEKVKRGQVLAVVRAENKVCFDMVKVLSVVGKDRLAVLEKEWRAKKFLKGDLMAKTGGLLGKKILAPVDGKFVAVDEFLNMYFELGEGEEKKVFSPVDSVVISIADGKLVLGFEALEFEGKVIIEGKVWGVGRLESVDRTVDLGNDCQGRIILSNRPDKAFLAKAEAMGVLGLVVGSEAGDDFGGVDLPILVLDKKEWKSLIERNDEGEEKQMLLNCRAGRLLVVI